MAKRGAGRQNWGSGHCSVDSLRSPVGFQMQRGVNRFVCLCSPLPCIQHQSLTADSADQHEPQTTVGNPTGKQQPTENSRAPLCCVTWAADLSGSSSVPVAFVHPCQHFRVDWLTTSLWPPSLHKLSLGGIGLILGITPLSLKISQWVSCPQWTLLGTQMLTHKYASCTLKIFEFYRIYIIPPFKLVINK